MSLIMSISGTSSHDQNLPQASPGSVLDLLMHAGPVVKWAGGKRQLLPTLMGLLPPEFRDYHEPFVGGGALFFELRRAGHVRAGSRLSDANDRLVTLYEMIRDETDALISELERLSHCTSRADYEAARREFNRIPPPEPLRLAALFLYLNRLCFNGLFRVNRKGEFNVPYGRYENPDVVRAVGLRAAAQALTGVQLARHDFDEALAHAGEGDLVYLDPPYAPISATSSFTAYAGTFGFEQQIRLSQACRELDARGVFFILSNSSNRELLELYRGFEVLEVSARRAINSAGNRRGKVGEIIVRNFWTP